MDALTEPRTQPTTDPTTDQTTDPTTGRALRSTKLPTSAPEETSADRTREVSRAFASRGVAALVGGVATLALSVLARQHLSPREFSQFVVFLSGLFVGPLLARFGNGSRIVRELSGHVSTGDKVKAGSAVRSAIANTTIFTPIFSILTTAWVLAGSEVSLASVALVFVALTTESIRLLLSDVMAALQHTAWAAALGHQLRTVVSLAAYAIALGSGNGSDLNLLLFAIASSSVFLLVIGVFATRRVAPLGPWPTRLHVSQTARLGLPFVLVELCLFVIARGDVWMANRYFQSAAAPYATASFLAMQLGIPAGLAGHAISPSIARLWHLRRLPELRKLLFKFQGLLAVVLLPGAIVAATLARSILRLFRDSSADAKTFFVILLIGNAIAGSLMLSMNTLLMIGRAWHAAVAMLVGVALYLPVASYFATRERTVAFAWTSTAASSLLLCMLTAISVRSLRSTESERELGLGLGLEAV
jgi:O-antigen/teichoic acid export membrane protein